MNLPELPERFSRLQFQVHKIKAESVHELFEFMPGLRRYFQKVEIKGKERSSSIYNGPRGLVIIIKYIVLLYDPDSDLVDEYADEPRLRKEAAAREAGFKREHDGEWPPLVKSIMDFEEPDVLNWIMDYLKVKKSNVWREIVFLEEELDKIYRIRANDIELSIKLKLDAESKRKIEELKQFKKQFYAEHSDLRKATEEELIPVSPENIYLQMKVPEDLYKVRQISDVSQISGLREESY
jgi:hypothetical protein